MGACVSIPKQQKTSPQSSKVGAADGRKQASKRAGAAPGPVVDEHSKTVFEQIKNIPIIQLCTDSQKMSIAQQLQARSFRAGQLLMSEGEHGHEFFLLREGSCAVTVGGKKVSTLRAGDYCGEQAMLNANCQRTATVRALGPGPTECLVMSKEQFDQILRATNIQFVNRRSANMALSEEDESEEEMKDEQMGKDPAMTDEVQKWLKETVQGNLLFQDMSPNVIAAVVERMTAKRVERGQCIIEQGSKAAKEFFVIGNGQFVVEKDGQKVDSIGRGACVGELALVFNAPRNATIRATSDGAVWVLTRAHYRSQVIRARKEEDKVKIEFLRKVPLLASMLHKEIALFARTLKKVQYTAGTTIFSQGDEGENFYLIMGGSVHGYEKRASGGDKQFSLGEGEWFGEVALRYNKPRTATISAQTNVVCLIATRADFTRLFGPMDDMMERQLEEYQRPVQSDKVYRTEVLMKRALADFEVGAIVGRGKYGLVQFVRDPHCGTVYALKSINKAWVRSKRPKQSRRRIAALFNERNVMRELSAIQSAPFVVKLRGTFKDANSVYFLMQACVGGDFFNVLKTRGYVDEKTAKFYIACVIEGIADMHEASLIHRDLKPENIVLDHRGYGVLTDFGFTKKLDSSDKTYTLCGTPGYMAPEVILGQGYGKGADWFAVGCVLYDMLTGAPPFPTRADQFMMIRQMMQNNLHLPMYLSFWAKDLICQLLKLKPVKRLGVIHGGVQRIRAHQWFAGFDWDALRKGTLKAPIQPTLKHDMDPNNFDTANIEQMSAELEKGNERQKHIPLPPDLQNWDVAF